MPDVLRIGVLPDQSKSRLLAQYASLVRYLEQETGLTIELAIANDYADLLDDFDVGRLHLVNFGGLTFVQAEHRSGAKPLVMRDTDLDFTSCFFVRGSQPDQSISDYEGQPFLFGPELSTSGHLMPRRFLKMTGINPEKFFSSVLYSLGHDETVAWVRDGNATIGAANCIIVRSVLSDSSLNMNDVRIIATTPAYSNYVWATHASADVLVMSKLRDAFLALDPTVPEHKAILQLAGANGYVPAARTDFDEIRLAARGAGLISGADVE